MRKLNFLLLLLFLVVEAGAKIVLKPEVGKQYLIRCISTAHVGYLGDDGTTLQGRHAEGTFFQIEAATDGIEGHYYLKSQETSKYINAASATDGAAITFDATPTTFWTFDQTNAVADKESWAIRPNGTAGFSLNNNNSDTKATCPYMKVMSHTNNGQGCCLWTFDDGEDDYDQPLSLPKGKYIIVSKTKADFLTPAEGVGDNKHWYLLTQERDGETPIYDNGNATMKRAASNTINSQPLSGNEKYLVRFIEAGDGLYKIQFATGNFVTYNLTTDNNYNSGGIFNLYNINEEATHIGWNKKGFTNIVDNNGPEKNLNYWSSGKVTASGSNNDWNLYQVVDFVDGVSIEYTLHSNDNGENYSHSYIIGWDGEYTAVPTLAGVSGYTITNPKFSENNGTYSLTADITFPFPVSNASKENATGIESELGNSKWFVDNDGNIKANNANNTTLNYESQDKFKWYIYPTFNEGTFSFKIKYFSGKYIPEITTTDKNQDKTNAVVDKAEAGSYYFIPCIGTGSGFSTSLDGSIFLTINSGTTTNQNIWAWPKSGTSHTGSNLSFPNVTITLESLQGELNTFKDVEKLSILEGSTVVGPSEFANPEEINAAIEAANAVNAEDITEIENYLASTDAQKIKNYLAQKKQYGALYNYQFEVTRQYNTIILPCPSARPEGITLYSCSAAEEDGYTLTLTPAGNFGQNVPYIMEVTTLTEENPVKRYTIIGWDKGSRATHTKGWLTGVLKDGGEAVPENSYVLATNKTTGVQGFFKVDDSVTCPQNKCYLTTPTTSQGVKAFYFNNNGETTGIEGIFGDNNEEKETVIYDLSGRRLNHLQKGVNIVNGHKILVK